MVGDLKTNNVKKSANLAYKHKIARTSFSFSVVALLVILYLWKQNNFQVHSPIVFYFFVAFFFYMFISSWRELLKTHHPCPYCKKSIKIKYNWKCDHCHEQQGKDRLIVEKCNHCSEKLTNFICPHCDKEFSL